MLFDRNLLDAAPQLESLLDTLAAAPQPEGVTVARRGLLLAGLGLGALALAPRTARATPDDDETPDDLPRILERALQQAAAVDSDTKEDVYLCELVASLRALAPEPLAAKARPVRPKRWNMTPLGRLGKRSQPPHVAAFVLHLAPGAKIPLHDHKDYLGAIVCLQGEAGCTNYDLTEAPEELAEISGLAEGEVMLRRTVEATLTPGRFSTLSRRRDNVHEVVAGPAGARRLDVFTFMAPGAGSRNLNLGEPLDESRGTFRATLPRRRRRRRRQQNQARPEAKPESKPKGGFY